MLNTIKRFVPAPALKWLRDIRDKQEKASYIGDRVECSICGSRYAKFAPFGVIKRENARCQHCESLERHRLIWMFLRDCTNFPERLGKFSLLHFAPEKPFYQKFSIDPRIEYFPCDLFPEIYDTDGAVPVLKADVTAIPFDDNHFDIIFCNHVLEHIPDDRRAMSELYRVMKPGGWGIFQVPIDYNRKTTYEDFTITDPKEREKVFGQDDHVRWYGQDYKVRLATAGFIVEEHPYVKSFSSDDIFRFGLNPSEFIYYCKKQ